MPGSIPTYPKVWAVGHRAADGLFNDHVVVQEKVDGSQISFARLEDLLHIRSKGAVIVEGAQHVSKLSVDGMFQLGVDSIVRAFPAMPEGVIFRGEYLNKPKHNTLAYDRTPLNHIVLFDATDKGLSVSREALTIYVVALEMDVIPQLFEGQVASLDALLSLLENESYLGGPKIEGIVVKNYERMTPFGDPMFAKYVSEAFKEKHVKDWKGRNPNSSDVVSNLIEMYRTEPRWAKAVQHLREAGRLKDEPADIGPLMGELSRDLIEECEDEIRDELWKHFGKKVVRGVQGGFAEWYKEQLAANAFSSLDEALDAPMEFTRVEFVTDTDGNTHCEQWTCDPPAAGVEFQVVRDAWHKDGRVRTIHEVRLLEVSAVMHPANPACTLIAA
jgi:hypothetical protein